MKALSRAIERFCLNHRNFGIPNMMLGIVIISGVVSLIFTPIHEYLIFEPYFILRGEIWRLVTWIFIVPTSGGMGIFFTFIMLYFYYFIGSTLEREWGKSKFTIYYLLGMVINIIYGFITYFVYDSGLLLFSGFLLSPSYLNMSMFFAFAVLFPDFTVRLFFIIPIKIKWLALANAAYFLYGMISAFVAGAYMLALLPLVAFLNFIIMCSAELGEYIRGFTRNMSRKASPQVINFKKEAKKVRRDMADKPYRHICAVCGKTDTEFPGEEFRYCSQCNGYHCFCSEHINNHIHF